MHNLHYGILDSWKNLILTIIVSTRVDNVKLDEMIDYLLQQETRRRNFQINIDSQVMMSSGCSKE